MIHFLFFPISGRDVFVSRDLISRSPATKDRRSQHADSGPPRTSSLLASSHCEVLLVGSSPLNSPQPTAADSSLLGSPEQGLKMMLPDPSPLNSPQPTAGGLKTMLPDSSLLGSPEQGLKMMLPDPSPLSSPEQEAGGLKLMSPDPSPLGSPQQGAGGLKLMSPDPSPLGSPQQGDGGLKLDPSPHEEPDCATEGNESNDSSAREDLLDVGRSANQPPNVSHTPSCHGSDEEQGVSVDDQQEPLFMSATPKLTSRLGSARRPHLAGQGGFESLDLLSSPNFDSPSVGGDPSDQLPPPFKESSLRTPSHGMSFLNDIQPPTPFQHAVFDLDTSDDDCPLSPSLTSTAMHSRHVREGLEREEVVPMDCTQDQKGSQPVTGSLIDFTTPGKDDDAASSPAPLLLLSGTNPSTSCSPGQRQGGTLPSYLYPSSKGGHTESSDTQSSQSSRSKLAPSHSLDMKCDINLYN